MDKEEQGSTRPPADMNKEEQWVLCSTCLVLVRSTKSHFTSTGHRSYYYPTDGQLNLVCSSCSSSFSHLLEAGNHMDKNEGHTELRETRLDGDLEVLLSLPKKDVQMLENMGIASLTPATSDIYSISTSSGTSTAQITERLEELVLRDNLRPKMVESRTLAYLEIEEDEIVKLKAEYVLVEDMEQEKAVKKIDEELESCQQEAGIISFTLTNVNSKGNVFRFEDRLQMLCLVKKTHICSTKVATSAEKARRIQQLLTWLREGVDKKKTIRNHEIHYANPHIYATTEQSNVDVSEISSLLGITRESLNIYTNPTGSIKGPIVLCIGDKILTDCRHGGLSGCKIPTEAHKISTLRLRTEIAFVLVVEKDTIFQALADRGFTEKHNCVMVSGSGQPSVSTRIVVRKLCDILRVPVYGLFDGNTAGAVMYCTYRFGSEGRAFDNIGLTVPPMKWIGLFPEDVGKKFRTTMKEDDTRIQTLKNLTKQKHIRDDQDLSNKIMRLWVSREMADLDIVTRYYDLEEFVLKQIEQAKNPGI